MAKKFYYHGKKNADSNGATVATAAKKADEPRYPAEKLSVMLESIGVSAPVCELLAKNRINTAGDLSSRTERDMFRIQGFNKKMLFELRDALKKEQMTFKPDEPKAAPKSDGKDRQSGADGKKPVAKGDSSSPRAQKGDLGGANKQQRGDNGESQKGKDSQRGKNDRRDGRGGNGRNDAPSAQKPQKKEIEKPEKLTEPLPVDKWRKIQKGGKWGFFDGFKTVIPAIYDEVAFFRDGLASVEIDEKCGYIDSENNIVIPLDYETAMSFSEGYACVVKGGKCGYIDKENSVVIGFDYDAATAFEEGEAKVKKDGRWGTITPDGSVKWII